MERKEKIRNLALVAIGVVMLFLAFDGPRMMGMSLPATSSETREYAAAHLTPMDGQRFTDTLAEANGRPSLIFVYASWCPWCKKQFPIVDALQKRFQDDLHVAHISIDKDADALSRYLMGEYDNAAPPFTAYHVSSAHTGEFYGTLANHGFTHSGSVPYLIVTNKDGKRVKEFLGLTQVPPLLEAIQHGME